MKFSVIIPVYNSEAFLNKCIDSIVDQGYDDYELILVDDGSSDSSRKICENYANTRENVHLICQENSGPSAARNRGISSAKGEYITFVDSDDWVKPEYFQVLENAVAVEPDLIFFGTGHYAGNIETPKAFPVTSVSGNTNVIDFVASYYLNGDICSAVNKVYSRQIMQNGTVQFPTNTVVEEDLQFVLQAVDNAEKLVSIQNILYCYNQRETGSITTKYNPKKFDCKIRAYKAELNMAEKWQKEQLAALFHDNYLSYISACINNLMYEACPMTKREKLNEIKRFYQAEETIYCISKSKGLSLRSKIMYWLIRLNLYRTSYLLHYMIFHIRRR